MPWVSRVPKCPSAWVLDCTSTLWAPECPSALSVKCASALRVSECLKCPNALVPWVPKGPSALWMPECPSALSTRVLTCPLSALSALSARVPWVTWVHKHFSQSVSQPASQSAGLRRWFSKLISTLRAHTLSEEVVLRLKKLSTVV